jgi:hypothetical protein
VDQPVTEVFLPTGSVAEPSGPEEDLASYLAEVAEPPPRPIALVVGRLWALDKGGPVVRFDAAPGGAVPARSVVSLCTADVGREVVLLFEQNDPARPLVMGLVQAPRPEPVRTEVDGEKLVFTAEREIVLRCGEASITLTRAGKVLIEGAYVLTKAAGLNRIKGAAVQIN